MVCAELISPINFSSTEPVGLFGSFIVNGSVKYTSQYFVCGIDVDVSVTRIINGSKVFVTGGKIINVSVTGTMNGKGVSVTKNGICVTGSSVGNSNGSQDVSEIAKMNVMMKNFFIRFIKRPAGLPNEFNFFNSTCGTVLDSILL